MDVKNPIQVSERIFQTIETMAQMGPVGLLELSKQLSLNKSTVHRILNSLICLDYVKQDHQTHQYYLSYKICSLANQILSKNSVVEMIHPYIKQLADQISEIVHLVQLEGTHAVYIDKVDSARGSVRLVSMVGKRIPLYCSGVGKALLADMSDDQIFELWGKSDVKKHTIHTITNFKLFMKEIRNIQKKGYAYDNEEYEVGIRCIAISLHKHLGSYYAISISAPKDRINSEIIEHYQNLLKETNNKIQNQAGRL